MLAAGIQHAGTLVAQEGSSSVGMSLAKRRLMSGGAWASGGKIALVVTALVANALLARMLSPQALGLYFLAFSVVQVGARLGAFGLEQTLVRFVAGSVGLNQLKRARHALAWTLGLGAVGAIGVGTAYLLIGRIVGANLFHAPALVAVTKLIALWIAVLALQKVLGAAFRSFHDIRFATIFGGLASGSLLTASLGVLWLLSGQATLATALLLGVGSVFVSLLVGGWLLHRKASYVLARGAEGHTLGFREIMRVAWPVGITSVTLFVLTQAPIWILGAFRPPEEVAVYGAAARAVAMVAMPLSVVNGVLPPLIAEMYPQGRKRELESALRTAATVAGIPAFLALAAFISFGGPILGLVFGDYYREGATILALLSIAQLINVWSGGASITMSLTGHQAAMLTLTVAGGLTTVVAALGVVGSYGGNGVAVATAAGIAAYNLALLLVTKRKTGMWTHVSLDELYVVLRAIRNAGR